MKSIVLVDVFLEVWKSMADQKSHLPKNVLRVCSEIFNAKSFLLSSTCPNLNTLTHSFSSGAKSLERSCWSDPSYLLITNWNSSTCLSTLAICGLVDMKPVSTGSTPDPPLIRHYTPCLSGSKTSPKIRA
jgi:hypothetical protein